MELEEALFLWLLTGVEQLADAVRRERGRSLQGLWVEYSAPAERWAALPTLSALVSSSSHPLAILPAGQTGLRHALIEGFAQAAEGEPDPFDAGIEALLERVAERLAKHSLSSLPHRPGLTIEVRRRNAPVATRSQPGVVALAAASEELLVSAHGDGRLLAWPTSGAAPREIAGACPKAVYQLVRGQRGRVLCRAPVGGSGPLGVVDTDTATLRMVDSGHEPDGVADLATSSRRPLSAGARDGGVREWDLRAGTSRPLRGQHQAGVIQLFALRDGRVLSTGKAGRVRLWDLDAGASREVFDRGGYGSFRFAEGPAGQILVNRVRHFEIWDLERGAREPLGSFHEPSSLTTLPDGRVLSGGMDGTTHLFDLERGSSREIRVPHSGAITTLIALAGNRILSTARGGGLSLWSLEAQAVAATLALEATGSCCLQISDELVAIGDSKGHVHFVEVASAAAIHASPTPGRPLLRAR